MHYTTRLPWLRAAVLGSYDGLISISSLIMGVAGAFSGGNVVVLFSKQHHNICDKLSICLCLFVSSSTDNP